MFLVKCECGCRYLIRDNQLEYNDPYKNYRKRTCPGCGILHDFEPGDSMHAMDQSKEFEIFRVPDNTAITSLF